MDIEQRFAQGVAAQRAGRLDEAEDAYRAVLDARPDHAGALLYRASLAVQRGRHAAAEQSLAEALRLHPQNGQMHLLHAVTLIELNQWDRALSALDRATMLMPDHVEAAVMRGDLLADRGRANEAVGEFARILAIAPKSALAWCRRGAAELRILRTQAAIESFSRALEAKPDYFDAQVLRGNALLLSFQNARALSDYSAALKLNPDSAGVLYNRGTALSALERPAEALADYARAFTLAPEIPYLEGALMQARMQVCDWFDYDTATARLLDHVAAGQPAAMPFVLVSLPADARLQRQCAADYAARKYPAPPGQPRVLRPLKERIRVAYLSGGLRLHVTGLLMVDVFERHDHAKFETIALSFAPDDGSAVRRRLQSAFDRFLDVGEEDDESILRRLTELDVDIAVDLDGFTLGSRTQVIARAPIPLKVNYLGFPGTSGASYMDYIIADRFVAPAGSEAEFSEKIVRLPHSYQPNSARAAGTAPGRAACGLPPAGLVFAAFNNAFKITPDLFAAWMRILKQVPAGVLWLLEANGVQKANLTQAAAAQGVDPARLIFAPRLAPEAHLARHAHADLFLDTWHCNGHTTASDALWCGVPVVTCVGQAFAGRVAASLLAGCGLDALITLSLDEYEKLAVALAQDPARLAALKQKLRDGRDRVPLFDSAATARALERAYQKMWQRECEGLAPESFDI